jgi:hypothetical protein
MRKKLEKHILKLFHLFTRLIAGIHSDRHYQGLLCIFSITFIDYQGLLFLVNLSS